MSTRSSTGQQTWWAAIAAVIALVMVVKPMGQLTEAEWKWMLGGLGVLMLWRVWGLLRSSSSSPGRIVLLLLAVAMAGSVAVVGIPVHWFRLPGWGEVGKVVMPLLLGMAAITAVLFGLAGLNRRRELNGAPQRSYVPILLNLIIVAAAWQVVRQPLWRESLQGMLRLPQLHSNRIAFEESVAPWVDMIQHPGAAQGRNSAVPTVSPPPTSVAVSAAENPAPGGGVTRDVHGPASVPPASGVTGAPAPANAEQWIQAAVHNKENPQLELRASIALVAEGRADQALSRLAAARERGCQSPELIRFHARLLRGKGRPAAAATVLETLVLSPQGTDEDLRENLGAWEQAGNLERAENLAERLLVKRPSRDLFRWVATRDAAAGRFERALLLLGQLSRRSPFDADDAYRFAEVALQAGRPELALDAVSMLEQAGHRSARTHRLTEKIRASAVAGSSRYPTDRPPGAGS